MANDSNELSLDISTTVSVRLCPKCGTANAVSELIRSDYRCPSCGFEMVYLDVTANGTVHGFLGWVKGEGEVILGRYKITSVLGKGGFGVTYLVEDQHLNNKRRALKEIPRKLFDDTEATLLSRLDHPSIPIIIDRVVSDSMVYLVLQFGGTRTLASERKRLGGRIPLFVLVPWMCQLCKALHYLHSQHPAVIHRDLKPDNILLDEHDRIMLIDFGIAKLADPATATHRLGRAVSFGFSSPEQLMAAGTDHRSDIYSLAATVYFLLTGTRPPALEARLAGSKLEPPSRLVPGIPSVLDRAIVRALDFSPDRRQQSVEELLQLFENLARDLSNTTRRAGSITEHFQRSLRRFPAIFAVMMVIGGLAVLAPRMLPESAMETKPDTVRPANAPPPATPSAATPVTPPAVEEPVNPVPLGPEQPVTPTPLPELPPEPQTVPPGAVTPSEPEAPKAQPMPLPSESAEPEKIEPQQAPKSKKVAKPRRSPQRSKGSKASSEEPDWTNSMKYEGGYRKAR